MGKYIFIILFVVVLLGVLCLILFTKKCVTLFDPAIGETRGGCYYIWQKQWWKPGKGATRDTKHTMQDQFVNFPSEYAGLTPTRIKIGEGKSFTDIPGLTITFLDVTDEGRCPSDVTCAEAGLVRVLVEAKYNGLVQKKELQLPGGAPLIAPLDLKALSNFLSIDQYRIFLAALDPYPRTTKSINKNKYEGVFFADTVKNLDTKKKVVDVAYDALKKQSIDVEKYTIVHVFRKNESGKPEYYKVVFRIPVVTDSEFYIDVESVNGEWKVTRVKRGVA